MKTAYFDCFSGVSGDMVLGALLDAGLPFEELEASLATLPLEGYSLETSREERHSIYGTRFRVHVDPHGHHHRGLNAIRDIIGRGALSDAVKSRSIGLFEALATVEGKAHNMPPDKVHFHEVGAVDSIIDIVGSVYGMESLGIGVVVVSPLPLGSGFVNTAHGRIPVPSPATMELVKDVPVYSSGLTSEMVTPTGAVLMTGCARAFGPLPPMAIRSVGYGVGSRSLPDRPNLLRVLVGDQSVEKEGDTVTLLETQVDDMSPEWLGFLMERLFDGGALDVVFVPVYMKKNRPGVQIQVMTRPADKDSLMEVLLRHSSAIGVRHRSCLRRVLARAVKEVESPWGPMQVKSISGADGTSFLQPEYEACRRIALGHDVPLGDVYRWVLTRNA